MNSLLDHYRSAVLSAPPTEGLFQDLLISRFGQLATYYSPFEHLNANARWSSWASRPVCSKHRRRSGT